MSETAQRSAEPAEPLAGPGGGPGSGNGLRSLLGRGGAAFLRQREASVFIVAVVLVLYFGIISSASTSFFTKLNIINVSQGTAPYAIIAVGEVLLLVCGEIDLSVGYVWVLSPFLMYFFITDYSIPVFVAIVLALICGAIIGLINGFLVVRLKVPSFIATLGTAFIINGFMLTISQAQAKNLPPQSVGLGKWFGGFSWAEIIWAILIVAIFHIVFTRTRWGLHTVATGGNLIGASEAGISVAKIKFGNFMVTSTLGAIAGILEAFRTNTIDPSAGGFTPMFYAVAAAVIGGTALAGGSGTVLGALLGMLVLAILQDGFNLLGISSNPFLIILGAAILGAMIANVYLTRLRRAGRS
ncbi:MAG TPA: ABC transporter permease [Streptosporangiaceae bacterium]|nr:ABC transporter permease [Streptosporangiaceae bacterium]